MSAIIFRSSLRASAGQPASSFRSSTSWFAPSFAQLLVLVSLLCSVEQANVVRNPFVVVAALAARASSTSRGVSQEEPRPSTAGRVTRDAAGAGGDADLQDLDRLEQQLQLLERTTPTDVEEQALPHASTKATNFSEETERENVCAICLDLLDKLESPEISSSSLCQESTTSNQPQAQSSGESIGGGTTAAAPLTPPSTPQNNSNGASTGGTGTSPQAENLRLRLPISSRRGPVRNRSRGRTTGEDRARTPTSSGSNIFRRLAGGARFHANLWRAERARNRGRYAPEQAAASGGNVGIGDQQTPPSVRRYSGTASNRNQPEPPQNSYDRRARGGYYCGPTHDHLPAVVLCCRKWREIDPTENGNPMRVRSQSPHCRRETIQDRSVMQVETLAEHELRCNFCEQRNLKKIWEQEKLKKKQQQEAMQRITDGEVATNEEISQDFPDSGLVRHRCSSGSCASASSRTTAAPSTVAGATGNNGYNSNTAGGSATARSSIRLSTDGTEDRLMLFGSTASASSAASSGAQAPAAPPAGGTSTRTTAGEAQPPVARSGGGGYPSSSTLSRQLLPGGGMRGCFGGTSSFVCGAGCGAGLSLTTGTGGARPATGVSSPTVVERGGAGDRQECSCQQQLDAANKEQDKVQAACLSCAGAGATAATGAAADGAVTTTPVEDDLEFRPPKSKIIVLPCGHKFHEKCLHKHAAAQLWKMRGTSPTRTPAIIPYRCALCRDEGNQWIGWKQRYHQQKQQYATGARPGCATATPNVDMRFLLPENQFRRPSRRAGVARDPNRYSFGLGTISGSDTAGGRRGSSGENRETTQELELHQTDPDLDPVSDLVDQVPVIRRATRAPGLVRYRSATLPLVASPRVDENGAAVSEAGSGIAPGGTTSASSSSNSAATSSGTTAVAQQQPTASTTAIISHAISGSAPAQVDNLRPRTPFRWDAEDEELDALARMIPDDHRSIVVRRNYSTDPAGTAPETTVLGLALNALAQPPNFLNASFESSGHGGSVVTPANRNNIATSGFLANLHRSFGAGSSTNSLGTSTNAGTPHDRAPAHRRNVRRSGLFLSRSMNSVETTPGVGGEAEGQGRNNTTSGNLQQLQIAAGVTSSSTSTILGVPRTRALHLLQEDDAAPNDDTAGRIDEVESRNLPLDQVHAFQHMSFLPRSDEMDPEDEHQGIIDFDFVRGRSPPAAASGTATGGGADAVHQEPLNTRRSSASSEVARPATAIRQPQLTQSHSNNSSSWSGGFSALRRRVSGELIHAALAMIGLNPPGSVPAVTSPVNNGSRRREQALQEEAQVERGGRSMPEGTATGAGAAPAASTATSRTATTGRNSRNASRSGSNFAYE
ncbi:unnamed protein product [Amoebophrya sp. A120]|nr:unnamed protein product [Amoebophrya sp. A120]|eukprot:GSA120T00009998001.1